MSRTDRHTDRIAEPDANHLVRAGETSESATDCRDFKHLHGLAPRPARRRSGVAVSERDWQILGSVACLRLVTARQVERLHFCEGSPLTQARRARRTLARLFDCKLLDRLERRVGGLHAGSAGFIYRLSARGRRLLGLHGPDGGRRRRLLEPTSRFVDHVLAVSELCVQLHELHRTSQLELVRFEAEPDCWRTHSGLGGERLVLKPDAFVIVAKGEYEHLSFVEVDLGTEGSAAIRRKAAAYRGYATSGIEQEQHSVFPRVVFLAEGRRISTLQRVLAALPDASALFGVAALDDALALVDGGSP